MPPHLADKCLAVSGKSAIFQTERTDIYVVYVKLFNFLRYFTNDYYVVLRRIRRQCELVTLRYVYATLRYIGSWGMPP